MFHLIVRLQDLHNIQEKLLHLTTAIFFTIPRFWCNISIFKTNNPQNVDFTYKLFDSVLI